MTSRKRPPKSPQPPVAPKVEEDDPQLAGRIRDSARQIWLAGLGAYTKAEEDAGRFFERLVHEGEELETRTRGLVERQVKAVEHRVEDVRDRATGTWDRLENLFDDRVSGALRRLGIPRREELEKLEARVAELEAALSRSREAGGLAGPASLSGTDEEE